MQSLTQSAIPVVETGQVRAEGSAARTDDRVGGESLRNAENTLPAASGWGWGGRSLLSCEWRVGLQSNSVKDRKAS